MDHVPSDVIDDGVVKMTDRAWRKFWSSRGFDAPPPVSNHHIGSFHLPKFIPGLAEQKQDWGYNFTYGRKKTSNPRD